MTDQELIGQLSERDVVALTIWGEARGQSVKGRAAVASVIGNRVKAKRFGKGFREVCLKPFAFSCWCPEGGQANYETVMAAARICLRTDAAIGPALRQCRAMADLLMAGELPDGVKSADHYLTRELFASNPPAWAKGQTPVCTVEAHVFLKVA